MNGATVEIFSPEPLPDDAVLDVVRTLEAVCHRADYDGRERTPKGIRTRFVLERAGDAEAIGGEVIGCLADAGADYDRLVIRTQGTTLFIQSREEVKP